MTSLGIGAIGVLAANGASTSVVMASVLAAVQRFDDLDVAGPDGEPLGGAIVPLEGFPTGTDRLGALALGALLQCVGDHGGAPAPLIVIAPAPEDLRAQPQELLGAILQADAALPIERGSSRVIQRGRQGIGDGLRIARDLLTAGRASECYVLGVDSLVTGDRLSRLIRQGAVIHDGNPDGVIPGEAAVALRFSADPRDHVLATVVGLGMSEEPGARPDADAPLTGRGLALAAGEALAEASESQRLPPLAGLVYDRSGPHRHFEELALARGRAPLAGLSGEATFMPGLSAGETGAAAGLLALATTAFFVEKRVIAGPGVCLFTSEDTWRGAAIVVAYPRRSKRRAHA
ncbi:MAG TPA: hypothetical protein VFG23_08610 [Polyangia bacterium]|nr:hypothetical protein [Polyangia bacterium]